MKNIDMYQSSKNHISITITFRELIYLPWFLGSDVTLLIVETKNMYFYSFYSIIEYYGVIIFMANVDYILLSEHDRDRG